MTLVGPPHTLAPAIAREPAKAVASERPFVRPGRAGSWLWFLGRCALFTFGAYVVIRILVGIARSRDAMGWGPGQEERPEPHEEPIPVVPSGFDTAAFASAAAALLFHFGSPIWMWIFV